MYIKMQNLLLLHAKLTIYCSKKSSSLVGSLVRAKKSRYRKFLTNENMLRANLMIIPKWIIKQNFFSMYFASLLRIQKMV